MGELIEALFHLILELVQEALNFAFESAVALIKRATYGANGTTPNPRRLFWFRVVDLLLAVHLAYVLLVRYFGYATVQINALCATPVVVVSGIAFLFCFLVGLQGESERGNRRYVFLSLLAAVLLITALLALAKNS